MYAENARHNGIAGSVRASREGADMIIQIMKTILEWFEDKDMKYISYLSSWNSETNEEAFTLKYQPKKRK